MDKTKIKLIETHDHVVVMYDNRQLFKISRNMYNIREILNLLER